MKQFLWELPIWIDRWRVVPRALAFAYLYLFIEVSFWFMGMPSPSMAHATFAAAFTGSFVGVAGLYSATGIKKDMKLTKQTTISTFKPESQKKSGYKPRIRTSSDIKG